MNRRRFEYDTRYNPRACAYIRVWDCRGNPITGVTAARSAPGGLRIRHRHRGPCNIHRPDGDLHVFEDFVPGAYLTYAPPERYAPVRDTTPNPDPFVPVLCGVAIALIIVLAVTNYIIGA